MTLGSPDSNAIGRYTGSTSLNTTLHALLNLALDSISAAFTKYVRTRTVRRRTTGTVASGGAYNAIEIPTAVIGSTWTHASGVFTCAKAGLYRVTLSLSYAANTTGQRGARLAGSGSIGIRTTRVAASTIQDQTVAVETLATCAVGDTITAQSFQDSGATLTVLGHIIFEEIV